MDTKIIYCRDCKALFDSLANLNRHISKTGCNGGQLIDPIYEIEVEGGGIKILDIRYKSRKVGQNAKSSLVLEGS